MGSRIARMGLLDDAINGIDEAESPRERAAREQAEAAARSRSTLDRVAADFARIARERGIQAGKVFGRGKRGSHGWSVVTSSEEGDNLGYIVYTDGLWGPGWEVRHQPRNPFARKRSRLEATRVTGGERFHTPQQIEQGFADAIQAYALRALGR